MRLWRISNYADLSGRGGELAEGRWHSRGTPVLYCAQSPAGALVEFLVHLPEELFPSHFQLIAIDIDEAELPETVRAEDLPADWMARTAVTRSAGDQWLRQRRSVLLRVPSVILPRTENVLVNPRHPSMPQQVRIAEVHRVPLDRRFSR